ncbi:MAG: Sec-independent protein translocase subunit TatB [Aquabacterium sp.]|jgi:sec-independent protein translocase protein TatB|uniref:Sec-independent protein translocase protein TatB n=1 Tax=Aquabacterium sp. TaxID=1872578 RepID=UPI001B466207|nr:Sec-independent protein translocase protein TatB [Aquabacterium sp.]MBP7131153.1 Sec-independent protein translocase subunit TatB [Aquabacterium sp.]MBP9062911.1 Sec-independent protein translocase subunit TatB [Aquabacterium sp.]MDQ5925569.1 sec-independent protein translocase protein TatB [Pseudomonadota bacterium]
MIDFGIDKLALIGAVALIVIGPEKLPRVARTVGLLLGKAQRYLSEVKSEVNRSIELEELKKAKEGLEDAARDIGQSVSAGLHEAGDALSEQDEATATGFYDDQPFYGGARQVRKNWRLKRGAMPLWYKQQHGIRRHVQSGAARVARFRPSVATRPRQP